MDEELKQLLENFDHAAQDWGWEKLKNDPLMKQASKVQYDEAKDALDKAVTRLTVCECGRELSTPVCSVCDNDE